MESKLKNLATEITHFAQQAREVGKDLQAHKDSAAEDSTRETKEYGHMFGDKVKDLASEIGQRAHETGQAVKDAEARERRELRNANREARENLDRLEGAARRKVEGPVTTDPT